MFPKASFNGIRSDNPVLVNQQTTEHDDHSTLSADATYFGSIKIHILSIRPRVNHPVLFRETITVLRNISFLSAGRAQQNKLVMVTYAIHVIVCLDTSPITPHASTGRSLLGRIVLFSCFPSTTLLPGCGKEDAISFRSTCIFYFRLEERHRISYNPRFRFKHIQMKMRAERTNIRYCRSMQSVDLFTGYSPGSVSQICHFPVLFFMKFLHLSGSGRNKPLKWRLIVE